MQNLDRLRSAMSETDPDLLIERIRTETPDAALLQGRLESLRKSSSCMVSRPSSAIPQYTAPSKA